VTLIDQLSEADDPTSYAEVVLPGRARLVDADVITYNNIGPDPAQLTAHAEDRWYRPRRSPGAARERFARRRRKLMP
jgi:hypothetical protein